MNSSLEQDKDQRTPSGPAERTSVLTGRRHDRAHANHLTENKPLMSGCRPDMTMLYRSTDRLCRCGASMKNLAHSASFESLDTNAPSKVGTKHLGPFMSLFVGGGLAKALIVLLKAEAFDVQAWPGDPSVTTSSSQQPKTSNGNSKGSLSPTCSAKSPAGSASRRGSGPPRSTSA